MLKNNVSAPTYEELVQEVEKYRKRNIHFIEGLNKIKKSIENTVGEEQAKTLRPWKLADSYLINSTIIK